MLNTKSAILLVALLMLAAFLAGCGGSSSLSSDLVGGNEGGDPTPPGPPGFEDPGAEPGPEFDPMVIPEDIVWDDSEPSGFVTCLESNPENGEEFTAKYASDQLSVYFTDDATMTEIEAAFTAIGAHKKRYSAWCSSWLIGLDTPAASCSELQAKVDLLQAQPKVSSVWKDGLAELPDLTPRD